MAMDDPRTEPKTETGIADPPPLKMSRILHAPRETVFRAWSSAEHVKTWFGPAGVSVPDARVELRVGGAFDVCMRLDDGTEHWTRGAFVEVDPPRRLVIDMRPADSAGHVFFRAFTVLEFSEALGGTRLDVTQTYTLIDRARAAPMVGGAPEGWRSTLDQLERAVIALQGGGEAADRSVVHATFHLERTYAAPAARVWRALTDVEAKQKWFGPPPEAWEQIERRMDVRVGGTERLKGRWEGATVSCFDATYHDVIAGERLVYSYEMHMNDRKISVSLATMQLKAEGAKTRLLVTEQGAFLDGYDDAGSREHGTGLLLDALGASLAD
jgi:uncharacterized protein YndB with AHSA1/START domain